MSNQSNIFRPGRHSVIQEFTAAFSDGVIYPADWVMLSTTAPGSQGSSGVIEGQTLTAVDYVEATLLDTTNLGCGTLALGVCMGKGIGAVSDWETVTGDVLADGDLMVIQSKGIHPQGAQADTGLLGDYLSASGTGGEPVNAADGTANDSGAERPVGVVMIDSTTYTRAAAGDTHGSVVYVDC